MDEDEVESWYDEEKQQAMDEYVKEIEDGKDREKAKEVYEKRLEKAIRKFNLLMNEKLDTKKKTKLRSFISGIREKLIFMKR